MNIKALWATFKFAVFTVLLILCALLLHGLGREIDVRSAAVYTAPTVVIDAGHGGEDGGAVGINGCIEKELNLEIALILRDLLTASGVNVRMTRSEDIMLYDADTPGKKKVQDLKNRVSIGEENENSFTVSIHMNTYPSPKYSGAQVYYSPNHAESKVLAEVVQGNIKAYLQPQNDRQIKEATSAIYLLHTIKNPAILIECGFISNQAEAELLCRDDYRHKVALTIYSSIIDYLNKEV
ncbi:MAG: N-acetylmuramoyl-L-alanine amidase [Clostridia bacterium]|nr:N-acetylmuramoyl-L-alanine amidase [Clostridia bacterium]